MADQEDNFNDTNNNSGSNYATSQRKVFVQRELERMKHVITRLHLLESKNAKRAQIAELKAREVEAVRHESERDARIREQLMIEERDRQNKQHQRVAAMREDRKQRAESSRRDLQAKRVEAARLTKEQHKFINYTLTESNAEHHDRCVAQHNAIRATQKQGSTARARTVDKKRNDITVNSARNKNELQQKEQELQSLMEQAENLRRKVDESKNVEHAANARLQDLCAGGGGNANSPTKSNRGNNNESRNHNGGEDNNSNSRSFTSGGGGGDDNNNNSMHSNMNNSTSTNQQQQQDNLNNNNGSMTATGGSNYSRAAGGGDEL